MAFQVSPGVNISEIDASTSVPALVTNIGAMVGQFSKGPIGQIVEVSNEEELRATFGEPTDQNYKTWFTASNFLAYSNALKLVRVVNDSDANAVADRARNALSGTVSTSQSNFNTQNQTGSAGITETIYGSSAQNGTFPISGGLTALDLGAGVADTDSATFWLHPRLEDGTTTLVAAASGASTDISKRNLTSSDVTVSVRGVGEVNGGTVPASRWSIDSSANGGSGKISLANPLATFTSTGPWYVHAAANEAWKTDGTAYSTGGFFTPLYTRQADANAADSAVNASGGTSHGHYFAKYGGTIASATEVDETFTLGAGHGLVKGDVVIMKGTADAGLIDGTTYFVATVATNDVTLSTEFNYGTDAAVNGTEVAFTTNGNETTNKLHKVFFMPSTTTVAKHELTTATEIASSVMLYAEATKDVIRIDVAQQTAFTMGTTIGSAAVSGVGAAGIITTIVGGTTYLRSEFTVAADSAVITFLANYPETAETVTIAVPARKSFPLSPAPNFTSGQTLTVTVAGTIKLQGTDFTLNDNNTRIEFVTAPADAAAIVSTIKNAATNTFNFSAASLIIKSMDDFDNNFGFGNAAFNGVEFAARNAGTWGNNINVYLVDESTYENFVTNKPAVASALSGVPRADDLTEDSSESSNSTTTGEKISQGVSLVVTDNSTGIERVVEALENLSKAGNGKTSTGRTNFYVNEINRRSNHVFITNHPAGVDWGGNIVTATAGRKVTFSKLSNSGDADGVEKFVTRPFGGGQVGSNPSGTQYNGALDLFSDNETVDIGFLMQGESADHADLTVALGTVNHLIDIAESRKDTIACISPREVDVASDRDNLANGTAAQVAFFNGVRKSNYAFADSNYKYVSDKYNDTYRYIPFNGDTAGMMIRSENERDAWFSPAGFNRGVVRGVVKTMQSQGKNDRDNLYKVSINPIVNFTGQGTVLFGDKTFTMKPSAFNRINVRRLFIVLEKSIATAAKFTLFEFNDEFTRAQFTSLIEPFLRDVKGRRGIYDFKVVCDETNNTGSVIDRNEFIGDIFIQPAKSINFVQLNFVAVRTGVDFNEIVGAV
jgi:phage tail sheath protein FI